MKATYLTTCVKKEDLPDLGGMPEIALIGRSNCGKSSLLNAILNHKNMARTSSTPGRTQAINFFSLNDKVIFADLPGYGFNKADRKVAKTWEELLMGYLEEPRVSLRLFLIDIRRGLSDEDYRYLELIAKSGPTSLVLTKADKLSRNQAFSTSQKHKKLLKDRGVDAVEVYVTSSLKKTGVEPLRESLLSI